MNQFQVKIEDQFETVIWEFQHRPIIGETILHKGKCYIIKQVTHPTDVKVLTILFIEPIK